MPPSGLLNTPGTGGQKKNATSSKKKTSPGQPTGFTFVDQSADLRSIADKKIVDSDQRHLIRSHVMQKVRKDERLQGKKRPTGRESARKGGSSQSTPGSDNQPSTPSSELILSKLSPTDLDWGSTSGSTSPQSFVQSTKLAKVPKSPSQGRVDPFNTLPGPSGSAKIIDDLIKYCFHQFIPRTFPLEANSPREYDSWRLKILQSQSANTATFFGMMATVAAHQAITSGRHKDLRPTSSGERSDDLLIDNDFAMMKSYALKATQARIAKNGWDGPTVEAIFSLIGAEHILGNFEEARVHLTALRKYFMDAKSIDPKSPASDWIPLTDVKGAIGTMGRPLFRLPWEPKPIPQSTMDKLYNYGKPEMLSLGTGFGHVDGLTYALQSILHQAVLICQFSQYNATRSQDLTAEDYETFRHKTLELEYDILSYIYPGSPTDDKQTPNQVNDIEQIARLAVLGITSSSLTRVEPSAGVGRALTHFQTLATRSYYTSLRNSPSRDTSRFIVWALLVFAQCATKQPEERQFITSLAWYSRFAGVTDWTTLENVCFSFLYIPAFHKRPWQEIWTKACVLQHAFNNSQYLTTQRNPPQQSLVQPLAKISYR